MYLILSVAAACAAWNPAIATLSSFLLLRTPPPPRSTLFPYTTLFRSQVDPNHVTKPIPDSYWNLAGAEYAYIFADRKSTRLNSSHGYISYAVFCLKKKKKLGGRVSSMDASKRNMFIATTCDSVPEKKL